MNDQTEPPFTRETLPGPACHHVPDDWKVRIETQVSDIHRALVGDAAMGHTGLIRRTSKLEAQFAAQDAKLLTWGGMVVGASIAFEFIKTKLFGS